MKCELSNKELELLSDEELINHFVDALVEHLKSVKFDYTTLPKPKLEPLGKRDIIREIKEKVNGE